MKTPLISIVCFLAAALLGAAGQYLYKTGADANDGGLAGYILSWRILLGAVCYTAVMVLFVVGFKQGGRINVLYPLYATTFIWAALISKFAFNTPITAVNTAGMGLLVVGMSLMGMQ